VTGGGGRRVVVTGMGGICALGTGWAAVREGLRTGRSGIAIVPELAGIAGMKTQLGAACAFERPAEWPRKAVRNMGRVAQLAARATEDAIGAAGLTGSALLRDGRTGVAYGSTSGSPPDMVSYSRAFGVDKSAKGVTPTEYLRLMSHTCAASLASFLGVTGRIIPTPSACTSGSQAIGYGYESIRFGRADRMLCGGADELHAIQAGVFDLLFAASTRNESPHETPRPFDADRDGLVVGEGAATLVLEEREAALARGAAVLAEIVGFATNCDGGHLTAPDVAGTEAVMRLGLADAGLAPADIGYVSAHATATEQGDVAESQATHRVFGERVPVSSLKGHLGHTLGACGALEAWVTIAMLREGWAAPTLNLVRPDPACAPLDHVMGAPRALAAEYAASHNFAFGGVNTSLVFRIEPPA
jgi:3-oxoacyl-[acyl-carrier-protein] synthase II